ncbi:MAG: fibronectin type III domain-containing protein, partial [Nanoarchaeota archaeon]
MNSPKCVRGFVSLLFLVLLLVSVKGEDTSLPAISIVRPEAEYMPTQQIVIEAVTDVDANCTAIDLNDNLNNKTMGQDTMEHSTNFNLDDGNYTFAVLCDAGNESSEKNINLKVDTVAPEILSYHPSSSTKDIVELEINTNEESTCRYSLEHGIEYISMTRQFRVTGHTKHRTSLEFENDGTYDIFIKCVDRAGNKNENDYAARIDVDVPPSARIILNEESPISSGTIGVTVLTSEPVFATPELKYTLQDSTGKIETFTVPLSGNEQRWTGHMIISESNVRNIGSFGFKGIDYGGNTGTEITSGNTFIVDSTTPQKVEYVRAVTQSDGTIKLEWEYDDLRDVDKFIIYRTISPGVTKLDYHDETDNTKYTDSSLKGNTDYYYRVIAVDEAGNKGALSNEVDARTVEKREETQQTTTEQEASSGLSSNLLPLVDESINKYSGLKKLVDDLVLYYKGQSNLDEQILEDLDIINKVSSAKSKVYNNIAKLEDLKSRDLEQGTLKNEIRTLEIRLESITEEIPVSITKKNNFKTEFEPTVQDVMNGVDGLLNLFRIVDLDSDMREEFIEESIKVNNNFLIESKVDILEIEYHNGDASDVLLVNKDISQINERKIDEQGLLVVEVVDESITGNIRDIEFISPRPDVLKNTMFKWDFTNLNSNIKYYIEKEKGYFDDLDDEIVRTTMLDNYKLHFDELGREPEKEDNLL